MTEAAEAFWSFSLALYAKPGVAPACLALQERHGLDVNLLLFACWAGSRGQTLTPADWARPIEASRDWHGRVVVPLRGLRRWLKGRENMGSGAAGKLRLRIKKQELESERIEQTLLAEALPLPAGMPDAPVTAANLAGYLAAAGVALGDEERDDCAVLLRAGFADLSAGDAARLLPS